MITKILPNLLALITQKPRIKVENLEWDKNVWSANIYRLWELLFWREGVFNRDGSISHKIRVEGYGFLTRDKYGFLHKKGTLKSFTIEHKTTVLESQIRAGIKAIFSWNFTWDYKIAYSLSFVAILLFLVYPPSSLVTVPVVIGAIAIDTNSASFSRGTSGTNTVTIAYASSGSNRYLVGEGADIGGTNSVSFTATYNAVSMTQIAAATRGDGSPGSLKGYVFGLANQATGTVNYVLTRTNSVNWVEGGLISLTGAVQTTSPIDAKTEFPGDAPGTTKSNSITTVTNNDAVFIWLLNDNGGGFTITSANLTALFDGAAGGFGNGFRTYRSSTFPYTPAGTLTVNWTQNATGDWFFIAYAIAPAGGAPANTTNFFMLKMR